MIGFAAKAESSPAFVGHVFDVGGDISDVSVRKLAAKRRHGVLAIGHLIGNGSLMAVAVVGQVGIEGLGLEGALTVDDVAATHMASNAVGGEDLAAVGHIGSEGGSGAEQKGETEGQQAKQATHERR